MTTLCFRSPRSASRCRHLTGVSHIPAVIETKASPATHGSHDLRDPGEEIRAGRRRRARGKHGLLASYLTAAPPREGAAKHPTGSLSALAASSARTLTIQ